MSLDAQQHWLDRVPFIAPGKLSRGTPLVLLEDDRNAIARRLVCLEVLDGAIHVAFDIGLTIVIYDDDPRWKRLRLDLDEPHGFACGLKLALQVERFRPALITRMVTDYRILRGELNDDDKVKLATALARWAIEGGGR